MTEGFLSTTNPPIATTLWHHLEAAEGRLYMALGNDIGFSPEWDAGWIVIGDAMHKPPPPPMTVSSTNGSSSTQIANRSFSGREHNVKLIFEAKDFVQDARFEYWVAHARSTTTIQETFSVQNHADVTRTVSIGEGRWTFTAQTRNSQGWSNRSVARFSVTAPGGAIPNTPTHLEWDNGVIKWRPPLYPGGLPLLGYRLFPDTGCGGEDLDLNPAEPGIGTPYPLQVQDQYKLRRHKVRVHWNPVTEGISILAYNRKGRGACSGIVF